MRGRSATILAWAILLVCPWARAEDAATLIAQADTAYEKREDVPQDKIAMITYERAALFDPARSAEAYWKASRAAWWLGEHDSTRADRMADYQRGADDAQKALVLDPNSVEAHFWYGGNLGSYGDVKGILKSLSLVRPIRREMQEVIRLNDRYSNGGAYHVLGVVDYKVPGLMGGSKKRAKEELDKALSIGPNDPFVHYYLAEFYKVTGDPAKKEAELDMLHHLQVAPEDLPEQRMLIQQAERELK